MTLERGLPEVWAGIECTVNRVGDTYYDQCSRNGYDRRDDDLDRFAALGIRALRCPFLWELLAPQGPATADWSVADARLGRLQRLKLRPIAGLVHHGSGPRQTSLIDPSFADGLAAYAEAFARRYPWVEDYTPVNEPLTTARFSALYGHWYPHRKDDPSFVQALLIQCRATVLAMQAVRCVNAQARLIQTEDMGRTYSTAALKYQADFENHRRWLSFDLLCGRVDDRHPLYSYLRVQGASREDLEFFVRHPTPPDVVGLNYYLTSDRALDDRLERYPAELHGGNQRDRYVDIEAVRVLPEGITGHRALLEAAFARYGRPVAFTEVHLGCTRAVTVWSLLGAYDWNSLVTKQSGFYEPGAFDLRGAAIPRPTAIAAMTRSLATTGSFAHPLLSSPGWWRRTGNPIDGAFGSTGTPAVLPPDRDERPVVITGATGTLGQAFSRLCRSRGLRHVLLSRADMDIADADSVAAALDRTEPWALINAAGYVRVDAAETDEERCYRENTWGPLLLARACRRAGIPMVTFSSDLVFAGEHDRPYEESDQPRPLSVYGRSKHRAEQEVLDHAPTTLVVRTGAFFGPWDLQNFLHHALTTVARGEAFAAAEDTIVSPTYVPDLVHACLDLLIDGEGGLWHLANDGAITWADLARRAVLQFGLDANLVKGVPLAALGWTAPRPRFSALGSRRARLLNPLDDALGRFLADRRRDVSAAALAV